MKSDDKKEVRIVVRKARSHGGHHGGAWKVAYADFVTTMMALFIVLWIVGQSDAVKQAVAQYFKNPGVMVGHPKISPAPAGAGLLPGDPPPGEAEAKPDAIKEERALQKAAARMREQLGTFEGVRDQVRIEVTQEGLRIELLDRDNSDFFRVGSAVVIESMRPVLEKLEPVLAVLPNHITVEGHTDSRQYSDRKNYSNWELSADRANSARRVLEEAGLTAGRIDRVSGHADRLLLVPGDPLHPSNRRITILVRRQGHR
jgi:chemotaxis protein MotB